MEPDFKAFAQQWANLLAEQTLRLGSELVSTRVELAAVKAELEVAKNHIIKLFAENAELKPKGE